MFSLPHPIDSQNFREFSHQAAGRGIDTKCTVGRTSGANTSSVFIAQLKEATWTIHLASEVWIQVTSGLGLLCGLVFRKFSVSGRIKWNQF